MARSRKRFAGFFILERRKNGMKKMGGGKFKAKGDTHGKGKGKKGI